MENCHKKKEKTVGERIAFYRKEKKMSQYDLAFRLGVSRQLLSKWEGDDIQTYTGHLDELCNILGVDKSMLLVGVSSENQTVYQDLGLTDAAIEELKREKQLLAHEYRYRIIIDEFDGGTDFQGYAPSENLFMINTLLSTLPGLQLLSLLYRYCMTDFSQAFSEGKEVKALEFDNASGQDGKTVVSTRLLRFATLKAVEKCIEDLRSTMKGE